MNDCPQCGLDLETYIIGGNEAMPIMQDYCKACDWWSEEYYIDDEDESSEEAPSFIHIDESVEAEMNGLETYNPTADNGDIPY